MYKIFGTDGKVYGPATAEQVRQWIAEGRANAQTQVLAEGAREWRSLGTIPEFAGLFAATVAPVAPGYPPLMMGTVRKTNGFATGSMVLGIFSWAFCCCYGMPFNLLGAIFGFVALAQISSHPERYEGRGMAITGIILSVVSILFYATMLIIAMASGNLHMDWNGAGL